MKPDNEMDALSPELEADFRKNFDKYHTGTGLTYEDFGPAYGYGYRMAQDPARRSQTFHHQEHDLKANYLRDFPDADWDLLRSAALYGWEKAGGEVGGFAFI